MKEQIVKLIGFLIFTAAIAGVSFYGINTFRGLRVKEICAQTYRYSQTLANGVVVSYPMQKEYSDCLNSKDILN